MKNTLLLILAFSFKSLLSQNINADQERKMVMHQSIISDYMNGKVNYHVYLPDAYKTDSVYFPVIYWLHGSGGWPAGSINMLANRFHSAIEMEKIPPTLVIFLDDDKRESMWVDWKNGSVKMESAIIHELIPHIDQSYRTVTHSRGRILEGGSMGGYGAARFGFKYPHLFGAISIINPGPMQETLIPKEAPLAGEAKAQKTLNRVYGGDTEYFRELSPWRIALKNADEIRGNLEVRIILGGKDPSFNNIKKFSEHLDQLRIVHTTVILEQAGHSPEAIFRELDSRYWDFFYRILSN